MSVLLQNNSVLKSVSGEVYSETANASSLILKIDGDLQFANRIHKSATDNKVKQITDKAQGIIFAQSDIAKQVVYNYNDGAGNAYYNAVGSDIGMTSIMPDSDFVNSDFVCYFKLDFRNVTGNFWYDYTLFVGKEYNDQFSFGFRDYDGAIQIIVGNGAGTDGIIVASPSVSAGIKDFLLVRHSNIFYLVFDSTIKAKYTYTTPIYSIQNNSIGVLKKAVGLGSNQNIGLYGCTIERLSLNLSTLNINDSFVIPERFKIKTHHYQRYPDNGTNKAFFSSKYLKDAVIDVNNYIEGLYSSVGRPINGGLYQPDINYKPILNKAISFTHGNNDKFMLASTVSDSLEIGTNDFYFGFWIYQISSSVNGAQVIYAKAANTYYNFLIVCGYSNVNEITIRLSDNANNTNLYTAQNCKGLNVFKYVSVLRKGYDICILEDGTLKHKTTESFIRNIQINSSFFDSMYIGNLLDDNRHVMDDILFSIGDSVIDPTGYSVGDKVFEPPIRGGFDSEFKIYPIP